MKEDRMVGLITLFRNPEQPPFDPQLDGRPLAILARLLAAAFGRAQSIERLRDRQKELLAFAHRLAQAEDRETVCGQLADFLHREVNNDDSTNAKVTVRLIDFGTGMLDREVCVGAGCEDLSISIFDDCIYANTVRNNRTRREEDARQCPDYRVGNSNMIAELCVPLAIGQRAIGAVNLEHTHTRQGKYQAHDEPFVESAAALAAQALARLKGAKFATDLLDFVEQYTDKRLEDLERQLRAILHDFCSYSVLATMEPSESADLTKPWRSVGEIDFRLAVANRQATEEALNTGAPDEWSKTWLSKLIESKDWSKNAANFTDKKEDFLPIPLFGPGNNKFFQQSEAVLWLRRHDAPPHRALLLLWGWPNQINKQDLKALQQFARLFSALEEREEHVRSLVEQNVLGEQAAAIGHVMQHFRHRLTNQTGAIAGYIDNLASALEHGEIQRAKEMLVDLQGASKKLAASFSKSQGYVKKVEARAYGLRELVELAINDLADRLDGVERLDELSPEQSCWTDPEIAQLIVYSLLENAVDAVTGQESRQLRITGRTLDDSMVLLRIEDNGHGILPKNIRRLFEFGFTTKANGLGSALAFAHVRARLLGAELRYADEQPARGAAFELRLPANQSAFDAAQTRLNRRR